MSVSRESLERKYDGIGSMLDHETGEFVPIGEWIERELAGGLPREWFLKGPIRGKWLEAAARKSSAAFRVGVALHFQRGMEGDRFRVNTGHLRRKFHIGKSTQWRGLSHLEEAGLLQVEESPRNRAPVIQFLDP